MPDTPNLNVTPDPDNTFSCVACDKPDSADNVVACDKCGHWWHYSCAGVTDSVSNREWTCPKCLPSAAKSASSTLSNKQALIQLELQHIAEQSELEKKQLQLDVDKKYAEQKYQLEQSLLDEEFDNRSTRSRVSAWEARQHTASVGQWIQAQRQNNVLPTNHASFLPPINDPVRQTTSPISKALRSNQPSDNDHPDHSADKQDETNVAETEKSTPGHIDYMQKLKITLEQCEKQTKPSLQQIRELQALLNECRIQVEQSNIVISEGPANMTAGALKGAVHKSHQPECTNKMKSPHRAMQRTAVPNSFQPGSAIPAQNQGIQRQTLSRSESVKFNNSTVDRRADHFFEQLLQFSSTVNHPGNINSTRVNRNDQGTGITYGQQRSTNARPHLSKQPGGSSHPLPTQDCNQFHAHNTSLRIPSPEQLAARQVMARDLPVFSGEPEEWPFFINCYESTTLACGYNNVENMARLQRCLKGNALRSVRYHLLIPDSVPEVIRTLETLFGRPEMIINKLLKEVRESPAPRAEKLETLIEFGLSVRNLTQHLIVSGHHAHLSNSALLQELVGKLPANVKLQWAQYLAMFPNETLQTFSDFMSSIVQSVCKVVPFSGQSDQKVERWRNKDTGHLHAHIEDKQLITRQNTTRFCPVCEGHGHRVKDCTEFLQSSVGGRWKIVHSLKLCRCCLKAHGRRACRTSMRCGIINCKFRHNRLLHSSSSKENNLLKSHDSESHASHHCGQSVLFRIVPITVYGRYKTINTFAFLDEGSSATLIQKDLGEELGTEGPTVPLCLKWTSNMTRTESSSQKISIEISAVNKNIRYRMNNVRTVENLSLPEQTLRYDELQKEYEHLSKLPVSSYENAVPKLLIGLSDLSLAVPRKVKEGSFGPIAAKTRLGWCIYGNLDNGKENVHFSFFSICDRQYKADTKLESTSTDYFISKGPETRNIERLNSKAEQRARPILQQNIVTSRVIRAKERIEKRNEPRIRIVNLNQHQLQQTESDFYSDGMEKTWRTQTVIKEKGQPFAKSSLLYKGISKVNEKGVSRFDNSVVVVKEIRTDSDISRFRVFILKAVRRCQISRLDNRRIASLPTAARRSSFATLDPFEPISVGASRSNEVSDVKQQVSHVIERDKIRKSWDFMRKRIHHHWSSCVREYLRILTKHVKWFNKVYDSHLSDLAIVIDESRRNGWVRNEYLMYFSVRMVVSDMPNVIKIIRLVSRLAILDVAAISKDEGNAHPYGGGNVATTAAHLATLINECNP